MPRHDLGARGKVFPSDTIDLRLRKIRRYEDRQEGYERWAHNPNVRWSETLSSRRIVA